METQVKSEDFCDFARRGTTTVNSAIYARKSTDQNVSDEEKSVTRQIEHARAYAARKGWTVADEHVYSDDGISGAEFIWRPGFLRLLNALSPRPPFQVLVMSEESRLGRESIETGWTLKRIIDAGVRVFYYLEDRERTLDSAMDKVMMHLSTFAAEIEREKARQRTYDAMLRKASARQVAGGMVYGYDNVEVLSPDGQRQLLRKLLAGRVIFTPHQDQEAGFYEFAGQASWGKLLTGVVGQLRWCPRGDSNTRHAV